MQSKLYSIAAPLLALPLMDFSLGEIPKWFLSDEFRNLMGELGIQVVTGVVDAAIVFVVNSAFGLI